MDTKSNESALVCAARDGDREALQALLKRHWSWLRALVYGMIGQACDLDDVMQDLSLRVMTRIHTLREPECFRAWLAMVARRETLKYGRQKNRRSALVDGQEFSPGPRQVINPLEDLERKELCRRILELAEALPLKYREVFILAHGSDLSYAQMAEVLDVPISTMQIRLVRARRMIRDQLVGKSEPKVYES